MNISEDKIINLLGGTLMGYAITSLLFPPSPKIHHGISVPLQKVYFTGADGSKQVTGTLGVKFAVVNPSDKQNYNFIALLDSGSSQAVISAGIAENIGVKSYPSIRDKSLGAPPTARNYIVQLGVVGLADKIAPQLKDVFLLELNSSFYAFRQNDID
ncbi:MAG: hypothetical protein WA364_26945 [Candidatus Nitrosopolaris sp.]